jgi:hypothetical protein
MNRHKPVVERLEDRLVPAGLIQDIDPASVTLVDVDHNGVQDILFRHPTTGGWGITSLDGRQNPYVRVPNSETLAFVSAGDFDADGDQEPVGFTQDGGWVIGNDAGGWTRQAQWSAADHWDTFLVGDFDGDRRSDVAGFNNDGSWWVGTSTGRALQTGMWAEWMPAGQWSRVFSGDFNGDRKADVAGFSSDGSWWVGTASGRRFTAELGAEWMAAGQWHDVFVADFNGDQKADVGGFSSDGSWWVGTTAGGKFQTSRWAEWMGPAAWATVQVGDFSGDGKADVLGINHGGEASVGVAGNVERMAGATRFTTAAWGTVALDRIGTGRAVVADFNADGAADVAVHDNGWKVGTSRKTGFEFSLAENSPFDPGSPWNRMSKRELFDALPAAVTAGLSFNTAEAATAYRTRYQGVLRRWVLDADLVTTPGFDRTAFLTEKLNAHFELVKADLAQKHPGLNDAQYRLLMTMNLVHGFYAFGTQTYNGTDLGALLHLQVGDCSEEATLGALLARLQGVNAKVVGLQTNYTGDNGYVYADHAAFYGEGMLFDSLVNQALAFDPIALKDLPPASRMERLISGGGVFGFYNQHLNPNVRAANLLRSQDPGVLGYYYKYYLEGINQGQSQLTFGDVA